jgi:hypothetical protein
VVRLERVVASATGEPRTNTRTLLYLLAIVRWGIEQTPGCIELRQFLQRRPEGYHPAVQQAAPAAVKAPACSRSAKTRRNTTWGWPQ